MMHFDMNKLTDEQKFFVSHAIYACDVFAMFLAESQIAEKDVDSVGFDIEKQVFYTECHADGSRSYLNDRAVLSAAKEMMRNNNILLSSSGYPKAHALAKRFLKGLIVSVALKKVAFSPEVIEPFFEERKLSKALERNVVRMFKALGACACELQLAIAHQLSLNAHQSSLN